MDVEKFYFVFNLRGTISAVCIFYFLQNIYMPSRKSSLYKLHLWAMDYNFYPKINFLKICLSQIYSSVKYMHGHKDNRESILPFFFKDYL